MVLFSSTILDSMKRKDRYEARKTVAKRKRCAYAITGEVYMFSWLAGF